MRTVALELSGGKDSVACLYLLRDRLEDITVYWLNTGDNYSETLDVIEECRNIIPHFVEVRSDVVTWRNRHGLPSDVIPVTGQHVHLPLAMDELLFVDSYSCCAANIMNPLHAKVVADGNTTIIRGQRDVDEHKSPVRDGDVVDGIKFEFPIQDWTDDEVLAYLQMVGAPIHEAYRTGKHGADCLFCTGWWKHSNLELLSRHPEAARYVGAVRSTVRRMVIERMELC